MGPFRHLARLSEDTGRRCFECSELLFAVTEAAQLYRARHTPNDQARGDIFLSGPVKISCAVDEDQWFGDSPSIVWNGAPPARSRPGVVNKRQPRNSSIKLSIPWLVKSWGTTCCASGQPFRVPSRRTRIVKREELGALHGSLFFLPPD